MNFQAPKSIYFNHFSCFSLSKPNQLVKRQNFSVEMALAFIRYGYVMVQMIVGTQVMKKIAVRHLFFIMKSTCLLLAHFASIFCFSFPWQKIANIKSSIPLQTCPLQTCLCMLAANKPTFAASGCQRKPIFLNVG